MTRMKNPGEVLDSYTREMGAELGNLFGTLSAELMMIHWKWSQYRALFGDKESRISLLNESAPFFFRVVQDVFFEDTLLAIARLVGPVETMKKPNLTILRLPPLTSGSLASATQSMVEKAVSVSKFAVDWRNRHLAHRDLLLALEQPTTALPPVSRQKIEDALTAIGQLLNHVEQALCRSTTSYRNPPLEGDAIDLLYVIRDGIAHAELREKCEREGRPLSDNITNQEPI